MRFCASHGTIHSTIAAIDRGCARRNSAPGAKAGADRRERHRIEQGL
jgi:hypothetical protein